MTSDGIKTVKVQPYPFPIFLHINGKVVSAEVLKLAQKGAILRSNEAVLLVGAEFQVAFEIPVHKVELNLLAKVMKTYDRALTKPDPLYPNKKAERLAEVFFKDITNDQIRKIYKFLLAIRQVKE
jgi:hypothetical protein